MGLPFTFDNVAVAPAMEGGTPEEQSARASRGGRRERELYRLCENGDPNDKQAPKRPTFDLARRPTMILDDKAQVEGDPRGQERTYIEQGPCAPDAG